VTGQRPTAAERQLVALLAEVSRCRRLLRGLFVALALHAGQLELQEQHVYVAKAAEAVHVWLFFG
jgi:hypothetical protein